MSKNEHQKSRRDFLKKAAYTAPVILTMTAMPALATTGSRCIDEGKRDKFQKTFDNKIKTSKNFNKSFNKSFKNFR